MSEGNKAVFLSYASQDAEAAKRICDALRAVGVEVWFDQSELVGGDAWDQKIRKHIKDCALLIPVISQNTQARTEGYFRLEWRLADQRTHLMAKGRPFLLPVVIDDTRDGDAQVPDSFTEVQWTRLPGGETSPKFAERVKNLLGGEGGTDRLIPPAAHNTGTGNPVPPSSRRWWLLGVIGGVAAAALAAYFGLRPGEKIAAVNPAPAAATAKPSPARELAEQAWELVTRSKTGPEGARAAVAMGERALELDAMDGEVWATAALVDLSSWVQGTDRTDQRLEAAVTKARRAKVLAPQGLRARLVEAKLFASVPRFSARAREAEAMLRTLLHENQPERESTDIKGSLGMALQAQGRREEAAAMMEEAGKASAGWMDAAAWAYLMAGRLEEALAAARRESAMDPLSGWIQEWRVQVARGDLAAAEKMAAQLRSRFPTTGESGPAFFQWLRGDPEAVLAELKQVPGDYVFTLWHWCPKRMLAGRAHHLAGREEAARSEWVGALQVIERRITQDGPSYDALDVRCQLLALLGRKEEAAQAYRLLHDLFPEEAEAFDSERLVLLGRLEEAYTTVARELRNPRLVWSTHAYVRLAPSYAPLRSDPRVAQLLRETLPSGAKPFDDPKPVAAIAGPPRLGPKSIAVLPFDNLSEEKEANAFFADGMHEDIITDLSVIRELRCVSRSAVMAYRGTEKSLREVADELGVAYLLTGTVRRVDKRVRITGTLLNPRTDETLWIKPYNKELTDVFSIQSELAQAIAGELKATLSSDEKSRVARIPTTIPAAYDLYLKARATIADGFTSRSDQGREKAVSLLGAAVQLDPDFGVAWCELASLQVFLYRYGDTNPEQFARAQQALEAAARVMSGTPEYLHALANFQYRGLLDYEAAAGNYEQLVRLRPNDALARHDYGALLRRLGQPGESLRELRAAAELDSHNRNILDDLAITLRFFRRYDEAMAAQRQVVALKPDDLSQQFNLAFDNFHARGSTREVDELLAGWSPAQAGSPEGVGIRIAWAAVRGKSAEVLNLVRSLGSLDDLNYWSWRPVFLAQQTAGDQAGVQTYLDKVFKGTAEWAKGHPSSYGGWLGLAQIEAVRGNKAEALAAMQRARGAIPAVETWTGVEVREYAAFVYLAMGDKERALDEIAHVLRHGMMEMSVHTLKHDLAFAALQGDPRFEALLADPKNNAPIY